MSRAMIYTGNSATQETTAGNTTITFPSIVRRFGRCFDVSGGNVVANGAGYFDGIVNLRVNGTAAGTLEIQVLANGMPIPYAQAAIETTATSIDSVAIPFSIRNKCDCESKTITVVASGVVTDVVNSAILVEKE